MSTKHKQALVTLPRVQGGRGRRIRTADRSAPSRVLYQTELYPECLYYNRRGTANRGAFIGGVFKSPPHLTAPLFPLESRLTPQNIEDFFEFHSELTHDLLRHAAIGLDLVTRQPLAGSADGKPVLI